MLVAAHSEVEPTCEDSEGWQSQYFGQPKAAQLMEQQPVLSGRDGQLDLDAIIVIAKFDLGIEYWRCVHPIDCSNFTI